MFADYENLTVAVITSLLSGTGVFLLGVRDGRISASLINLVSELFTAVTAGIAGFWVAGSQEWPEGIIFCVVLIASNNGSEILQGMKARASSVLNLISVIVSGGKGGEK
ncbi:holin [Escherichia coli]|nr:holin [Escherichia coli]EIH4817229.1 holin [Escherichia coli]